NDGERQGVEGEVEGVRDRGEVEEGNGEDEVARGITEPARTEEIEVQLQIASRAQGRAEGAGLRERVDERLRGEDGGVDRERRRPIAVERSRSADHGLLSGPAREIEAPAVGAGLELEGGQRRAVDGRPVESEVHATQRR